MKSRGYTLLELLASLAIVAVLYGLASPVYERAQQKLHRSEAQAALLQLAQLMEQYAAAHQTYAGAAVSVAQPARMGVPGLMPSVVPADGRTPIYDLQIMAADDGYYLLAAMPRSVQQADGFLQLDSTGLRGRDVNGNGRIDSGEMSWLP